MRLFDKSSCKCSTFLLIFSKDILFDSLMVLVDLIIEKTDVFSVIFIKKEIY